jgi:transposase-like protein
MAGATVASGTLFQRIEEHWFGMDRHAGRELAELRRENRRLKEDVEILKRARAFFAKETR